MTITEGILLTTFRRMQLARAARKTHYFPPDTSLRAKLLWLNRDYRAFVQAVLDNEARNGDIIWYRMPYTFSILAAYTDVLVLGGTLLGTNTAAHPAFQEYIKQTIAGPTMDRHPQLGRVLKTLISLGDERLAQALVQPANLETLVDLDFQTGLRTSKSEHSTAAQNLTTTFFNQAQNTPWRLFLLYADTFARVANHLQLRHPWPLSEGHPLNDLAELRKSVNRYARTHYAQQGNAAFDAMRTYLRPLAGTRSA